MWLKIFHCHDMGVITRRVEKYIHLVIYNSNNINNTVLLLIFIVNIKLNIIIIIISEECNKDTTTNNRNITMQYMSWY